MSYKFVSTPQGKGFVRVRHSAADKTTVVRKIKLQDGTRYSEMVDGSRRREKPKLSIENEHGRKISGKSVRRIVIKARRKDRLSAKGNLKK